LAALRAISSRYAWRAGDPAAAAAVAPAPAGVCEVDDGGGVWEVEVEVEGAAPKEELPSGRGFHSFSSDLN